MTWSKPFTTLSEIPREHKQSFLTIPEAARLATVPDADIRRAIADGSLQFYMAYSRRKLIRVDSLRHWVTSRTASVAPEFHRPKRRTIYRDDMTNDEYAKVLRKRAMRAWNDTSRGNTVSASSSSTSEGS